MAFLGDEADLAGVLGHEIGHVTSRHGTVSRPIPGPVVRNSVWPLAVSFHRRLALSGGSPSPG